MSGSLVIQTSFLGDTILTTPLIAELAKRGPVDALVAPAGAAVLANNPAVRSIIRYDKRNTYGSAQGLWKTVKAIRRTPPYDAAYLAQGSLRSALLAILTGAHERVGFGTSAGSAFYTRKAAYRPDCHHSERLWWLSMTDCADPPVPSQLKLRLYPAENDFEDVDALLRRRQMHDRPFVALAPGSIWGTKRWPYYVDLARRLSPDYPVAIIGSERDRPLGDEICKALPEGAALNAAGKLSVLASAELIRRAAALATNDSAPQHMASAMNTPTLSFFGPTVPEFGFGPLASVHAVDGVEDLDCRPCHRHGPRRCPLGHWKCMRELGPKEAHAKLMGILSTSAAA